MPTEGDDNIAGVEVSINIDVLWLVLAQGLFAHAKRVATVSRQFRIE